jgi:hypothetical protein
MRMRALLSIVASVALVAGCAPGSVIAESLEGCREVRQGQVGSAAFGLVNTGSTPVTLESITGQELSGGTVVDAWFEPLGTEANPEPVVFGGDRADRAAQGAVITDLAGTVVEPDEAGYVTIAVRRDGRGDALLEVVDITTATEVVSAPVRLRLTDSCE